jgi:uncharacterized protein (TIGR03790 family)
VNKNNLSSIFFLILFLFAVSISMPCAALEKENILVIANKNVKESVFLANYYMKKRGIADEQLIILKTATTESCNRSEYKKNIAGPVYAYLKKRKPEPNATCLLLMYGMPLKIANSDPEEKSIRKNIQSYYDISAAVDSELAMIYEPDYPLSGWIENPLYTENKRKSPFVDKENIFMICRLDGPSPEIVQRIIDDSIETEKQGVKGNAFFDAQWPEETTDRMNAYRRFDKYIHMAAKKTIESGTLPCKIDTTPLLFQKGDCPNTALYCGWYSLANYVDAFEWAKGAVAYHVASAECNTLKNENSRVWCKVMLTKGVAATLGPVGEPYLQSFPRPNIFFGFLFDGHSIVESYMKSIPYLSWKMVLIGDPMYHPFKNISPNK